MKLSYKEAVKFVGAVILLLMATLALGSDGYESLKTHFLAGAVLLVHENVPEGYSAIFVGEVRLEVTADSIVGSDIIMACGSIILLDEMNKERIGPYRFFTDVPVSKNIGGYYFELTETTAGKAKQFSEAWAAYCSNRKS
jgi:hypothetical protein